MPNWGVRAGTQYAWKAEQLPCPISGEFGGREGGRGSEEEKGALQEQIEELKQKEGRDGEKVHLCFSHPTPPRPRASL